MRSVGEFSLKPSVPAQQNTFEAGWNAAKQRLQETGYLPPVLDEIFTISGQVQGIENNKITLNIHPLEPLADPELDVRIIEVDENTKIYQLKEKEFEQYEKEMKEYNKKMKEQVDAPELAPESIIPPEPFIKETAKLSNIRQGQEITVTSKENIKNKKQFRAIEIVIQ
ncbi:MAG: hypothetical protein ACTSRP_17380 [Candidatus Helarchaeota archaeon]